MESQFRAVSPSEATSSRGQPCFKSSVMASGLKEGDSTASKMLTAKAFCDILCNHTGRTIMSAVPGFAFVVTSALEDSSNSSMGTSQRKAAGNLQQGRLKAQAMLCMLNSNCISSFE